MFTYGLPILGIRLSPLSLREDMNASWNAVVNDISAKIKDQEEERIAQDEENASLRAKLHVCLRCIGLEFCAEMFVRSTEFAS